MPGACLRARGDGVAGHIRCATSGTPRPGFETTRTRRPPGPSSPPATTPRFCPGLLGAAASNDRYPEALPARGPAAFVGTVHFCLWAALWSGGRAILIRALVCP